MQMETSYGITMPKELTESARSLEHLGISELAWNWKSAIKAIEFLSNNNCAILGGDVYDLNDDELNVTSDSWYFNKSEARSDQDYLIESSKRAITYINQYHARNGEDFYYSIVSNKIR